MPVKIVIEATVADDIDLEMLLARIVAFDRSHPGCVFKVLALESDQSVDDVMEMFKRLGLPVAFAARR